MPRILLWFATLIPLLLGSCWNTGTGSNALDVLYLGPFTVVTTVGPGGSLNVDHAGDPSFVGPKEVGIQLNVFEPMTIHNLVLSYWPAGNKAGSQSIQKAINQSYTPDQGGIGLPHVFEIPGTAQYGVCDALYYMFAVSYQRDGSTSSLYIGQPRRIMPTKPAGASSELPQALCAEPPGPDV
jgi:hypothetical protein